MSEELRNNFQNNFNGWLNKIKFIFKNAEIHEVGPNLNKVVNKSDGKIKYIAIKGAVLPLGKSLRSINNKDIYGVIQKLTLKEHVVARTSAGFW